MEISWMILDRSQVAHAFKVFPDKPLCRLKYPAWEYRPAEPGASKCQNCVRVCPEDEKRRLIRTGMK